MQDGQQARRVVWLVDSLQAGGAERLALRFATLAPAPWRVEVWALQAPPEGPAPAQVWGAPWQALAADPGRTRQFDMRHARHAAAWLRLVRALRREPPALVHAHLRYATLWGGAAAGLLRLPWLTTVHLLPGAAAGWRERALAAGERAARRRASRVIYLSLAQQAAWAPAPQRERAVLRGNGVAIPPPPAPQERAARRQAQGWREDDCVFVTVAVVRPRKGWRTWVQAAERVAARCARARFVWVGGGPEFAALAAAVRASPAAPSITLAGPSREVGAWLGAGDVFLFPSEEEALPTAVLEAMAAGLPVIASALPAIAEVLGGCGRLTPPGDAAALAEAMLAWAAPDPCEAAARRAAGDAARRRALAHYSEAAWVGGVLSLYEEVVDGVRAAAHAGPAAHSDGGVLRPRRADPL
jgi:glycosyltransferase involved in cell wall biosynthesis